MVRSRHERLARAMQHRPRLHTASSTAMSSWPRSFRTDISGHDPGRLPRDDCRRVPRRKGVAGFRSRELCPAAFYRPDTAGSDREADAARPTPARLCDAPVADLAAGGDFGAALLDLAAAALSLCRSGRAVSRGLLLGLLFYDARPRRRRAA